jgi:hypothetical protein
LYKIVVLPFGVEKKMHEQEKKKKKKKKGENSVKRTGIVKAEHENTHLFVSKDLRKCLAHFSSASEIACGPVWIIM